MWRRLCKDVILKGEKKREGERGRGGWDCFLSQYESLLAMTSCYGLPEYLQV